MPCLVVGTDSEEERLPLNTKPESEHGAIKKSTQRQKAMSEKESTRLPDCGWRCPFSCHTRSLTCPNYCVRCWILWTSGVAHCPSQMDCRPLNIWTEPVPLMEACPFGIGSKGHQPVHLGLRKWSYVGMQTKAQPRRVFEGCWQIGIGNEAPCRARLSIGAGSWSRARLGPQRQCPFSHLKTAGDIKRCGRSTLEVQAVFQLPHGFISIAYESSPSESKMKQGSSSERKHVWPIESFSRSTVCVKSAGFLPRA